MFSAVFPIRMERKGKSWVRLKELSFYGALRGKDIDTT